MAANIFLYICFISLFTQERNRTAATHAGSPSTTWGTWTDTSASTPERSRSPAAFANAVSIRATAWKPISRYTPVRNPSCATSAGRVSPTWGTWGITSVSMSEATVRVFSQTDIDVSQNTLDWINIWKYDSRTYITNFLFFIRIHKSSAISAILLLGITIKPTKHKHYKQQNNQFLKTCLKSFFSNIKQIVICFHHLQLQTLFCNCSLFKYNLISKTSWIVYSFGL